MPTFSTTKETCCYNWLNTNTDPRYCVEKVLFYLEKYRKGSKWESVQSSVKERCLEPLSSVREMNVFSASWAAGHRQALRVSARSPQLFSLELEQRSLARKSHYQQSATAGPLSQALNLLCSRGPIFLTSKNIFFKKLNLIVYIVPVKTLDTPTHS